MLNNDPFLDFVMQEAEKIGKLFLIDSGEGNSFIDSDTGWDVEDLSGWLINPYESEKFISARKKGTLDIGLLQTLTFSQSGQSLIMEILKLHLKDIKNWDRTPIKYWSSEFC